MIGYGFLQPRCPNQANKQPPTAKPQTFSPTARNLGDHIIVTRGLVQYIHSPAGPAHNEYDLDGIANDGTKHQQVASGTVSVGLCNQRKLVILGQAPSV